jgi:hypothetical protein
VPAVDGTVAWEEGGDALLAGPEPAVDGTVAWEEGGDALLAGPG